MAGIMDALLRRAYHMRLPASGTFELTARCNLDCKMCYIHKKEHDSAACAEELPTSFWLDMVHQLKEAGTMTLLITGGEPFLRKDFKEIYLAAKMAGLIIIINSNGTMLNDDMIHFLSENPPARINISLYGASEDTYRELCGRGEVYTHVTENIRKLVSGGVNVLLHFTVTPFNKKDIEAVYRFAKELGLRVKSATYMFPPMRTKGEEHLPATRMSPEEAAEAFVSCTRCQLGEEDFLERASLYNSGLSVPDDTYPEDLRAPAERIFCRAGSSSFWITYNGTLLPCGLLPLPALSLVDTSFASAWERLKAETQKIYIPTKCAHCDLRIYCEVCAANCYSENLQFDQVPNYVCKKTQRTVELMQQALIENKN